MSRIGYSLLHAAVWLWSLLPLPLLHAQGWVLALLARHVLRYRLRVVRENVAHAFPALGEKEREAIVRGFYHHFCTVIVEIVKLMSISPAALRRRVKHRNPEVLAEMTAHGGGGIAVFGHFANWEWLGAGMGLHLPFSTVGVYKTLSSPAFNRLMLHLRTRLGNEMITMEQTYRESLTRLKHPCYIAFLGDQTPARHAGMYFTPFMGRLAPVHLGIATISLRMNVPLYYFDIRRAGRGRYDVWLRKVPHEDLLPYSKRAVQVLTDRHVAMLEQIIRSDPSAWLWSHRRWKHSPRQDDTCGPTT